MTSRTRSLLAVAVAGAALAPVAAPAHAAKFRISVKGVQTNAWHFEDPVPAYLGRCAQGGTGKGTEVVRFASPKAETIELFKNGKNATVGTGYLGEDLTTKAKVTRQAKFTSTPIPRDCIGNLPSQTRKPDCGTKRTKFPIGLEWVNAGRTRRGLVLQQSFLPWPGNLDLFKNCGAVGTQFPNLIERDTKERRIVARVPTSDLFNPKLRKHIVKSAGRRVETVDNGDRKITLSYTLTLTRVVKKKGGR